MEVCFYYFVKNKVLYFNGGLSFVQEKALLGKEIGFQFLKLEECFYEICMMEVDFFDKLFNNFKVFYFFVVLLMDEKEMIEDIEMMACWWIWDVEVFLELFVKYDVIFEMFIQCLINFLFWYFNIQDLFFLCFFVCLDLQKFEMIKEMYFLQFYNFYVN